MGKYLTFTNQTMHITFLFIRKNNQNYMYQTLTARISIVLPQEYAMQYHKYVIFLIWIGRIYRNGKKLTSELGIGHTNSDIPPSEH